MAFQYGVVFIYRYNETDGALFGVNIELPQYDLASIDEIEYGTRWGNFIIVEEGFYVWNQKHMDYIRA